MSCLALSSPRSYRVWAHGWLLVVGAAARGRRYARRRDFPSGESKGRMMARDKGWGDRPRPMRVGCSGLWLVLGLCLMASPSAFAQDDWWPKSFPGFGGQSKSEKPYRAAHGDRPERQKPPALNDLRPDRTPLRSQDMIDAVEAAIERYQTIVTKGGWPTIPGTQPIRPEDNDERVALLYRRLAVSGEWKRRPQQSLFGIDYSEGMEEAVRRFQENHGLRVTGRVDRQTLQALNVPAIARLAQLRINLQRLRDLVAMKHGRPLRTGQCRRVPARGRRARPGGAAPPRHRRQDRASDAHREGHHPGAQLLPLLARARERGHARPHPAPRQRAGVSPAGEDPRVDGLLQRAGGRCLQHRLAPGRPQAPPLPAGSGRAERARLRAHRHAELRGCVHARHAHAPPLQPALAGVQRRLHPRAGRVHAGRMDRQVRARLEPAGADQRGPRCRAGARRDPVAAVAGVLHLYHGLGRA